MLEEIQKSLKILLAQSHDQRQDLNEIKDDVGSLKFGFAALQETTTELNSDSKRQNYKLHKVQDTLGSQEEKIEDLGECLEEHKTDTTEQIRWLKYDVNRKSHPCGPLNEWTQVVDFDMRVSTTTYPDGWVRSMFSVPTCGRATRQAAHVCYPASFEFPQGELSFSKVCGRIKAYAYGKLDGFNNVAAGNTLIHQSYVTGVSLTIGDPMQHVWTFVAAGAEYDGNGVMIPEVCPCGDDDGSSNIIVPPFVGNNYFCEAASNEMHINNILANDPLWDGKNCDFRSYCCNFNHPPYFVYHNRTTADAIDARICLLHDGPDEIGDFGDDILVESVEIYVAP